MGLESGGWGGACTVVPLAVKACVFRRLGATRGGGKGVRAESPLPGKLTCKAYIAVFSLWHGIFTLLLMVPYTRFLFCSLTRVLLCVQCGGGVGKGSLYCVTIATIQASWRLGPGGKHFKW